MTYLLAISVGPVQDFLAAARRTNDLYAGSHLISNITWSAAEAVAASGSLIFPAPRAKNSAKPAEDEMEAGVGANKILAIISANEQNQVKEIVEEARKAAAGCLRESWNESFKLLRAGGIELDSNIADQQLNTFIEFFAAWREWDGEDASYPEARKGVEHALAARKALRDFKQPQKRNIARSSLDPSRDAVTTQVPDHRREVRPLYLKPDEQLDAVSVIKRVLGGKGSPSTADIAAETYLLNKLDVSRTLCEIAAEKQTEVKTLRRAVYASMRKEMVEENDLSAEQSARIEAAVGQSEPNPYFAILLADGDRIGESIGRLLSPAQHIAFSKRLAGFAAGAATIVAQHNGYCVYSGGDDVLAFVPVHTCLLCAAQLARTFQETVHGTLSVGIAIVHYHEPLYSSLNFARDTEKLAKNKADAIENQSNRLAVTLYSRSGQARSADWSWKAGYDYSTWRIWGEAFAAGLSRGLPYEWERIAREMQGVQLPAEAVMGEAMRIFRRKRGAGAADEPAEALSESWVKEHLEKACETGPAIAGGVAESGGPVQAANKVETAMAAECLLAFSRRLMLLQRLSEFKVRWEEG